MKQNRLSQRVADARSDVDMTPMLDIVFIMLIFFIVTTSFVKESAVDINSLTKSSKEDSSAPVLVVEVDAIGNVTLDGRNVSLSAISPSVEAWKIDQHEPSVIVKTSPETPTWMLVKVVDEIKLASIDKVSVTPWIE
ncbi:MAG: biopolymer transporter ExbD [Gammaproteobacteria bacterium]|nr:biopolymer transporter ExbD [Gammaproteobacteria bacterium]